MSDLPQGVKGEVPFPLFHNIFHRPHIGVFSLFVCLIDFYVLSFLNPYWNKKTIFTQCLPIDKMYDFLSTFCLLGRQRNSPLRIQQEGRTVCFAPSPIARLDQYCWPETDFSPTACLALSLSGQKYYMKKNSHQVSSCFSLSPLGLDFLLHSFNICSFSAAHPQQENVLCPGAHLWARQTSPCSHGAYILILGRMQSLMTSSCCLRCLYSYFRRVDVMNEYRKNQADEEKRVSISLAAVEGCLPSSQLGQVSGGICSDYVPQEAQPVALFSSVLLVFTANEKSSRSLSVVLTLDASFQLFTFPLSSRVFQ